MNQFSNMPRNRVSRRRFIGGMGATAAAAAFLVACGDDEDSPSASGAGATNTAAAGGTGTTAAGGFTFTDDRGVTVTLPTRPVRIVAQADSVAALHDLGIETIAVFGEALPADTPQLASRGLGDMESVGEVWAEIDIEKLASLRPDLIVTRLYPSTDPPIVWGIANESLASIEAVAPIVTIDMLKVATHGLERFAELAAALGTDLESPAVAADIKHFEDASDAVRTAAAAKWA